MGARILIVDDERTLVHTLRQFLSLDLPDVDVPEAYSGEEALSHLADSSYDLIIADLCMPRIDGLELIKGVRYLDPAVLIVLMTAYGSQALQDQAHQLGANHYIDKPFDTSDMLLGVCKCLSGRQEADA